jgi:short subunit fatty acids transporter
VAAQEARHEEAGIRRVNEFFVRLAKQDLPDPYILAIILTGFTFVMALVLTDRPFTSLLKTGTKASLISLFTSFRRCS